ncbi:MAG: metallophosphoesterase [Planctomycetota bacterium]|jgi:hypothetical protein
MDNFAEIAQKTAMFEEATQANLFDDFRHGYEIVMPAEGELFVIGDIHGHTANFEKAVALADLDHHPERHLLLQEVIHQLALGEDHSYEVLEMTAELKRRHPHQVHVILGNHDLAEWQGREIFKGGLCLNLLFRSGIRNRYGEEGGNAMHQAYKEFIATMPVAVRACGNLLMVHTSPERRYLKNMAAAKLRGAPSKDDLKPRDWIEQMVWGRDFAAETADGFAAAMEAEIFIVGHTPCKRGYRIPNHRHVIIDSKDKYGVYVQLDLAKTYTQDEVVAAIQPLTPGTPIGPKALRGSRAS